MGVKPLGDIRSNVFQDGRSARLSEQREELQRLIRVGKHPARVTARARVLLKSDDGWPAPQVAEALDVALGTVYRVSALPKKGALKDLGQAFQLTVQRLPHRRRRADHHLVSCIRSSSVNEREDRLSDMLIDADSLLWFDQESGSLPFQKAFE